MGLLDYLLNALEIKGHVRFIEFTEALEENLDETNSSRVNKPVTPLNSLLIIITSLFLDFCDAVISTPMVLSFLVVLVVIIYLPLSFLSRGGIETFFSTLYYFIQFIPGYAGRKHFDTNDILYMYGVFSFILFLAWSLLRVGLKKVLHARLNFHLSFRSKLKIAILYFTTGCALLIIAWMPKDPGAIFAILLFYVVFIVSTFIGLVMHEIIQIFRKFMPKPEL